MIKQARVYIKGDVVGVGFRAWTKIQAKTLQVSGWVRNEYMRTEIFGVAGGVEALVQAEEKNVDAMIEILRKGPPVSRVDDIEILWEEPKEIFDGFEIRK